MSHQRPRRSMWRVQSHWRYSLHNFPSGTVLPRGIVSFSVVGHHDAAFVMRHDIDPPAPLHPSDWFHVRCVQPGDQFFRHNHRKICRFTHPPTPPPKHSFSHLSPVLLILSSDTHAQSRSLAHNHPGESGNPCPPAPFRRPLQRGQHVGKVTTRLLDPRRGGERRFQVPRGQLAAEAERRPLSGTPVETALCPQSRRRVGRKDGRCF